MIISRTPYRISFFGGGTDYPCWFQENKGAVLSTTIDKYCYITVRYLPPFFTHKHRITYSKIDAVRSIGEIRHPVVRAVLKEFGIRKGLEIHHDGDVPAHSGLGTSSSFTVGILNSLHALRGKIISRTDLAKQAIHIERDVLQEHIGSQDQVAAAFGGFNRIIFNCDNSFILEPITLSAVRIQELESNLMLIYTGLSRFSSDIAAHLVRNIPHRSKELRKMCGFVDRAVDILDSGKDIDRFGRLLHTAWQVKKGLSDRISTGEIDKIYSHALEAGAIGGKILGAGSGGFILLFVPPKKRKSVTRALRRYLEVNFKFENHGSQIIHYNNEPE